MKAKNPMSKNATKGDLLILKSDLEYKLGELEQRVDDKAKQYRDQILSKMDEVMGELQAIREDNIIGTHQTRELREEVDEHKKRIKSLEKIQTSP